MTTKDALLALSEDQENAKALLELGMNERQVIEKAARRWFIPQRSAPGLLQHPSTSGPERQLLRPANPQRARGLKSMPR